MPTYRVFGSRTQEFYTKVTAADPGEAYDIAYEDPVQWFEVEIDDSIEPYEVFLDEDTSEDQQLNKDNDDNYPSMESGILIEGPK